MKIHSKYTVKLTPYIPLNGNDYIYKCYPMRYIYETRMLIKIYINSKNDIYAMISFTDSYSDIKNASFTYYLSYGNKLSAEDENTNSNDRDFTRYGRRFSYGEDIVHIGNLQNTSQMETKCSVSADDITKLINRYIDNIYYDSNIFRGLKRLGIKIKQFFNSSKIYISNEPTDVKYKLITPDIGELRIIGINDIRLLATSHRNEENSKDPMEFELFLDSNMCYIKDNINYSRENENLYKIDSTIPKPIIFAKNSPDDLYVNDLFCKNYIINGFYVKAFLNCFCKGHLSENLLEIIKHYIK